MLFREIGAVVFDMDGTLVDSEPLSIRAIEMALERRGDTAEGIKAREFHGLTFTSIADRLLEDFPGLVEPITPGELQATFHRLHHEEPPVLIQGSHQALLAAVDQLPTVICTCSQRESLQALLNRLKLPGLLAKSVCAEDCTRSKPDPQGYLLAASRLGVTPERCLVFEDSVSGVNAALAAGMHVVVVTECSSDPSEVAKAAHSSIKDFTELPSDFFEQISRPFEG